MNIKYKLNKFLYKNLAKPIFFRFDPEFVHDRMTHTGNILGKFSLTRFITKKIFRYDNPKLHQKIFGINFANPVGLSAGFDKNANLLKILPSVGFGFEEIGSVTHRAYEGNPKPRLYRLKKSHGLSVYYGLKNEGVEKIALRIQNSKIKDFPINISIAKTNCKETSTEDAGIQDYCDCAKYLVENDIGDLYTINISCPNTFGGEPFTTPEKLNKLLAKLDELQIIKPVFVKMPINLDWEDFKKLLDVCTSHNIAGVTIGNLTKVRDPELIKDDIPENVKGGISGKPTWELSNNLIKNTYKSYGDKLKIIGVGGIFSAEDAYTKIRLGSTLVELITGMIFEGPQLIGEINYKLAEFLKRDGFKNISEAIGVDARQMKN